MDRPLGLQTKDLLTIDFWGQGPVEISRPQGLSLKLSIEPWQMRLQEALAWPPLSWAAEGPYPTKAPKVYYLGRRWMNEKGPDGSG